MVRGADLTRLYFLQVLAAPDMEGKKRRGGKRFRKMRERYGMTDTRKAANRVNFNQAEEEFLDGDEVLFSPALHLLFPV